jgi:signal transduction histidine kinase
LTVAGMGGGRPLPSIRAEMLRAQMRPVLAMALVAATLISLLIVAQYAWLRIQSANPLDEVAAEHLGEILRGATPAQWPGLTRWLVAHRLGMEIEPQTGPTAAHARTPDGRRVALADMLCVVAGGQRIDFADGRPLGPAPARWQAAIEGLAIGDTRRLAADATRADAAPEAWPVLLVRLDAQRVAALASPDFRLAPSDIAALVGIGFAASAVVVAGFAGLFLFGLRRWFADRSAARLSAPVERLAAAVRLAAAERDASRRVAVEAPAEVAQLAADFNRMQDRLAQTLAERARLVDAQRELVASLSHELRTPLAVLRGHAELLARDAASAAQAEVMLRQIEDLHRLLSDLLDMARLESIESTLSPEEVPLAGMMEEMIARFGAAAWRQGVVLRSSTPPTPAVAARADARWLRQIVANLLSNAIRHTPQGGLVTLDAYRDGTWVRIVIEDTGTGLGSTGPRSDPAGRAAGIGLRVVGRLAAAMRGSASLEATDDGGTRAVVSLPATDAASQPV